MTEEAKAGGVPGTMGLMRFEEKNGVLKGEEGCGPGLLGPGHREGCAPGFLSLGAGGALDSWVLGEEGREPGLLSL